MAEENKNIEEETTERRVTITEEKRPAERSPRVSRDEDITYVERKRHSKMKSTYVINPEEATTHLDYLCSMGTSVVKFHRRQSKIMCTIGRSSRNVETLEKMIEKGMDIARIMLGKGNYDYHKETIDNIRQAVKNYSEKIGRSFPLAIAADIRGAEIRTGYFERVPGEDLELKAGSTVKLSTDKQYFDRSTDQIIYVDYENITKVVKEGNIIFLNKGYMCLIVTKIYSHSLDCYVQTGGKVKDYAQLNLPDVITDLPSISERDRLDIVFAAEQDLDLLVASFVRNVGNVQDIREVLGECGKKMHLICKIENGEGLDNFEKIAEVSDGIVVARGDLGIELSMEKVFLAQKFQVATCNIMGKTVFVTSQLLESMVTNSRPSRSEASDIANAVLDGVDVLVLSRETSKGKNPVECVSTLAEICEEAEACIWRKQLFRDLTEKALPPVEATVATAICAVQAAIKVEAAAIIAITHGGGTAQLIAKYRPRCPIFAITKSAVSARVINCYKGVIPYLIPPEIKEEGNWTKDMDARVQWTLKKAQEENLLKIGDAIVVVSGWKQGLAFSNTVRVLYIPAVNQSILY